MRLDVGMPATVRSPSPQGLPPSLLARGGRGGAAPQAPASDNVVSSAYEITVPATRGETPPLPTLALKKREGGSAWGEGEISKATDQRFRDLLSEADWRSLPPAIRARFSRKVAGGESVLFRGQTIHLEVSPLGRLIAQAARVIGAPLPLDDRAELRPAVVAVTERPSGKGQIWTRVYSRRRGFPQMVNSVKKFAGPTGLEEHVGAGVSMSLALSVDGGALLFKSVDYFLTVLGLRIKIPRALTPGVMTIGHHDIGAGEFHFTLTLTHPLLGVLIEQEVRFHDMEEAYDRRSRLEPDFAASRVRRDGYAAAS